MTKLKTLKDLLKDYRWDYDTFSALKQEAIKWVKELNSQYVKIPSGCSFNDSLSAKIDWIKHFFNITKEDLK